MRVVPSSYPSAFLKRFSILLDRVIIFHFFLISVRHNGSRRTVQMGAIFKKKIFGNLRSNRVVFVPKKKREQHMATVVDGWAGAVPQNILKL